MQVEFMLAIVVKIVELYWKFCFFMTLLVITKSPILRGTVWAWNWWFFCRILLISYLS